MFALRIVTVDHYLAPPIRGIDECYSEFRCSEIKQVPVIRVFGSTPAGQKTCLHLHGIFPYICVPFEAADPWDKYAYQLAISLDKALNIAMGNMHGSVQYVFKVSLISGVPFYGYHPEEKKFLKIYFYNPLIIKKAVELLENGAVMNHMFQPHEAHIPYILQMFIDYNLYGMNLIYMRSVKFRQRYNGDINDFTVDEPNSPQSSNIESKIWNHHRIPKDLLLPEEIKSQTKCELEIDGIECNIHNKELFKVSNRNPGIEAIWENERIRRRNQGEPSQISLSSSQDRGHIFETESEKMHKQKLLSLVKKRLSEKMENIQMNSTSSSSCRSYEDIHQESEVILETNEISRIISQDPDITVPIVNEEVMLSLNSSSCLSQQTNLLDSQDEALIQLLANANTSQSASQNNRILSTPIKQDNIFVNEIDEEDKEIWEMSQEIWETELNLSDFSCNKNNNETIKYSEDIITIDDNDIDEIPQLDGPVDPKCKNSGKTRGCRAIKQRVPVLEQLASFMSDSSPSRPSHYYSSGVNENIVCNNWITEESFHNLPNTKLNTSNHLNPVTSGEKLNTRTQVIRNLRLSRLSLKSKQREKQIHSNAGKVHFASPIKSKVKLKPGDSSPKRKRGRPPKLKVQAVDSLNLESNISPVTKVNQSLNYFNLGQNSLPVVTENQSKDSSNSEKNILPVICKNNLLQEMEIKQNNQLGICNNEITPNKSLNSVGTNTHHSGLSYCSRKGFYRVKYRDLKVHIPKYVKLSDLLKLGHEKLSLTKISEKTLQTLYPKKEASCLIHDHSEDLFDNLNSAKDVILGHAINGNSSALHLPKRKLNPKKHQCWELQQNSKSGLKILLKVQNHCSSSENQKFPSDMDPSCMQKKLCKTKNQTENASKLEKPQLKHYRIRHTENISSETGEAYFENNKCIAKDLPKQTEGIATTRARRIKVDYNPCAFLPLLQYDNIISDVKDNKKILKHHYDDINNINFKDWPQLQVKIERLNLNSHPDIGKKLGNIANNENQSKYSACRSKENDLTVTKDANLNVKNSLNLVKSTQNIRKRKLSLVKYKSPKKTKSVSNLKQSPLNLEKAESMRSVECTPKKCRFPELKIVISPFSRKIIKKYEKNGNIEDVKDQSFDHEMPNLPLMSQELVSAIDDNEIKNSSNISSFDSIKGKESDENSFPPILEREDNVLENENFSHVFMTPSKEDYVRKKPKGIKSRLRRRTRSSKDESIDSESEPSPLMHRNLDLNDVDSNDSTSTDTGNHFQHAVDNLQNESGVGNKIELNMVNGSDKDPFSSNNESQMHEAVYKVDLCNEFDEKITETTMKKIATLNEGQDDLSPPDLDEEVADLQPMQFDDNFGSERSDDSEDSNGIEDSLMLSEISDNSSSPKPYMKEIQNSKDQLLSKEKTDEESLEDQDYEPMKEIYNNKTSDHETLDDDGNCNISQHCIKIDDKFCKDYLCDSLLQSTLNRPGCSKWGEDFKNFDCNHIKESVEIQSSFQKKPKTIILDTTMHFTNGKCLMLTNDINDTKLNNDLSTNCSPVLECSQDLFSPVSLSPPPPPTLLDHKWEDISSDENDDSNSFLPDLVDQKKVKNSEIAQHCISSQQPTVYSTSLVNFLKEESRPINFKHSMEDKKTNNQVSNCNSDCESNSVSIVSEEESMEAKNLVKADLEISNICNHSDDDLFGSSSSQMNVHNSENIESSLLHNETCSQSSSLSADTIKENKISIEDRFTLSSLKSINLEEEKNNEDNDFLKNMSLDYSESNKSASALCESGINFRDSFSIEGENIFSQNSENSLNTSQSSISDSFQKKPSNEKKNVSPESMLKVCQDNSTKNLCKVTNIDEILHFNDFNQVSNETAKIKCKRTDFSHSGFSNEVIKETPDINFNLFVQKKYCDLDLDHCNALEENMDLVQKTYGTSENGNAYKNNGDFVSDEMKRQSAITNEETELAIISLLNIYNEDHTSFDLEKEQSNELSLLETLIGDKSLSEVHSSATVVEQVSSLDEAQSTELNAIKNIPVDSHLNNANSVKNLKNNKALEVIVDASLNSALKKEKNIIFVTKRVLSYAEKPPSIKNITESINNNKFPLVKHQDAFCSDPKDISEKCLKSSNNLLRISSGHLTDLPEFEGHFQKVGLENWRTILAAHFGLELESTGKNILNEIKKNYHMRNALVSDKKTIILTPNLPPPSYKSVAKWAEKHLKKIAVAKESDSTNTEGKVDLNQTEKSTTPFSDVCDLDETDEYERGIKKSNEEIKALSVICEEPNSLEYNDDDLCKNLPLTEKEDVLSPLVFISKHYNGEKDIYPLHSTPLAPDKLNHTCGKNNQNEMITEGMHIKLKDEENSCGSFTLRKRFKHDSSHYTRIKNKYLKYYSKKKFHETNRFRDRIIKKLDPSLPLSRTPSPLLSKIIPSPTTTNKSSEVSPQIESLGSNVTCDFKISYHNLQDAKISDEYQFLTTMSIELHIETREDLRPDPEFDPVLGLFYTFRNDVPSNISIPQEINGAIIVDKIAWESCKHCQEKTTFICSNEENKPSSVNSNLNNTCSLKEVGECSNKNRKRNLLAKLGVLHMEISFVPAEEILFKELIALVERYDPDIIVGYEIQMLSWGYLLQRSAIIGTSLKSSLSRISDSSINNSSAMNTDDSESGYSSELNITGRIALNLWSLMKHEAALTSYTFENIVYHILHKRVPRFSFKTLTEWFSQEQDAHRWRVVEYYMTRVKGNFELMAHVDLIGRTSELARLFGIQFLEVLTRGSQFRVESMMLRTAKAFSFIAVSPSVQQRARMRAPECIPLVMEPESKFYSSPVLVLDFQSLYPSIIIAYNYCFSTCLGRIDALGQDDELYDFGCTSMKLSFELLKELLPNNITVSPVGVAFVKSSVRKGVLPRMLEEILETRIMVKKAMKKCLDNKALYKILNARQLGLKLIANVTYGYTAANFSGRMPCVEVGDSIVSKARETLEKAIHLVVTNKSWNAEVVYGDTDSMFVHLPGRSKEEAFRIGEEIADAVTSVNPNPVKLKFEKVYLPCVLQTKKRYVGYMFETLDQKEPVFDAKGIETVRRDGCPAAAKILEKSLKILFNTRDISQIKQYVQKHFQKFITGRMSIQDCIFAREYRGLGGYKPGARVPAIEITKRLLKKDRRAEPRPGERVPYVIIYGSPGEPLFQLVRHPEEVLSNSNLRINSIYYINNAIIPPLQRVFGLIGVDIKLWYTYLPKSFINFPEAFHDNQTIKKGMISHYFNSSFCPVCSEHSSKGLCTNCQNDPQTSIVTLTESIKARDILHHQLNEICSLCTGTQNHSIECVSLDCPIFFQLIQTQRDLQHVPYVKKLDGLPSDF